MIASADVVVVCVPTPLTEEGGPDLAARARGGLGNWQACPSRHPLHPRVDHLPRNH